jgi:hypothetical protein
MHPADQGKSGAVAEGVIALAANDDLGPSVESGEAAGGESAGWDPFEVWRTRVRDARRAATESTED